MKTQRSNEHEDRPRFPSLPLASTIHAHLASLAMAGPSNNEGSNTASNNNRRSRFRSFSFRQFFGGNSSFSRQAPQQQHCQASTEVDSYSETNSAIVNHWPEKREISGNKEQFYSPAISLGDAQLYKDENAYNHSGAKDEFMECPLCLLELPRFNFPALSSCSHHACYNCLQQYLRIEITESRVNISCPECTEPIHPNDISLILNDSVLITKYENFMLRRVLVAEPDIRWCPAPDCGYAVLASGCASCPKLKCERPGCNTYFCYHCKQEWHPNQTCDAARVQRAQRSSNPRSASVSFSQDSIIQAGDDVKPCPMCKALIIKMDDGSCNHMTCSVCGTEFCWLCMKEISDLHYLSPSGCTFWGKKPWSRKKKIMWQLGMLVGAPVGIALIAGIAFPAIIFGIPVWVGRKIHGRFSHQQSNRHKRNFVITIGVLFSILVSPILAGIAVGIAVPILLAYVYGVVPISLCRSGGCGVTTSASGVRIEFDEENDIGIGSSVAADGVSVDTATSHRGVNPSIGEVSLGMSTSLSLGSGSHLERLGLSRDKDSDRESASNTALAGSIASASLVGTSVHKLEVQADVSSNKRFSLSSHSETASATVSFSERSANLSLADDASTKALAGSILGGRDGTAVTPVEVHVDAQSSPDDMVFPGSILKVTEISQNEKESDSVSDAERTECINNAIPLSYPVNEDCPSRSHFKWWKQSGRWQQNSNSANIIPESVPSTPVPPSNDHSTVPIPSHVHFSNLGECCVSYIDESPVDGNDGKVNCNTIYNIDATCDGANKDTFQLASDNQNATVKCKSYGTFNADQCKKNQTNLPSSEDSDYNNFYYTASDHKPVVGFSNKLTKILIDDAQPPTKIHTSSNLFALSTAPMLANSIQDVTIDIASGDNEQYSAIPLQNSRSAPNFVSLQNRTQKLANLPHVEEPEGLSQFHSGMMRPYSAPHSLISQEVPIFHQTGNCKLNLATKDSEE